MLSNFAAWCWMMLPLTIVIALLSVPWQWCVKMVRDPALCRRTLRRASRFTISQLLVTVTLLGVALGLVLRLTPPDAWLAIACLTLLFAMSFFVLISLTFYAFYNALRDTRLGKFIGSLREPFSWRHVVVMLMGGAAGVVLVGAFVARAEWFQAILMGGSVALTMVAIFLGATALLALGIAGAVDVISFGRGSERRINRLRELENSQSIRLPRTVPRRKRKRIGR